MFASPGFVDYVVLIKQVVCVSVCRIFLEPISVILIISLKYLCIKSIICFR